MSTTTNPKHNKRKRSRQSDTSHKSDEQLQQHIDQIAKRIDDTDGSHELSHAEHSMLTQRIMMLFTVLLPFAGLVTGIVLAWQYNMMNPFYLWMMIGGWLITGLGITIGYHRMLTHRSFETNPVIHTMFTLMGALAIEGSPLVWVAVHRKHHQRSDLEGDPHSPHLHGDSWLGMIKGAIHAHMGWLFGHAWSENDLNEYVPDLMKQRATVIIDKFYGLTVIATLGIPTLLGGLVMGTWEGAWLGLIWGGLARMFMTHHVTWSINSICHLFGGQEFKSNDDSRNNLVFGILGHGEGWHNNHHAFPTSARHGLHWWQIDLSWYIIRSLEFCGMAWNVKLPSERARQNKQLKNLKKSTE